MKIGSYRTVSENLGFCQSVTVNPQVPGSSPGRGANIFSKLEAHQPFSIPPRDTGGTLFVRERKVEARNLRGSTTNWVKVKTAHGRHVDEERAKWNE
jgi:hypothetical protein